MNLILTLIKWYLIGIIPALIISISLIIFLKLSGYSNLMIRQLIGRDTITEGIIYGSLKSWLTVLIMLLEIIRVLVFKIKSNTHFK